MTALLWAAEFHHFSPRVSKNNYARLQNVRGNMSALCRGAARSGATQGDSSSEKL